MDVRGLPVCQKMAKLMINVSGDSGRSLRQKMRRKKSSVSLNQSGNVGTQCEYAVEFDSSEEEESRRKVVMKGS